MYMKDGKLKSEVLYEFYLANPQMTYKEIAEHFGINIYTLNSALYYARKKKGNVIPRGTSRH